MLKLRDIENCKLKFKNDSGVQDVKLKELIENKNIVMFGVPGAFTSTCSAKHLPSYIKNRELIIEKGISVVACMAVNDPHVMLAWGEANGVVGKIDMLSDTDCSISESLGLDMDFGKVMGRRSRRFSMVVDNNIIIKLFVEEVGAFEVSSAENMLKHL